LRTEKAEIQEKKQSLLFLPQSLAQAGLECFQGWGIDHISGQPVPVFHHPHCKRFLPYY